MPLDRELRVESDGGGLRVLDGETLIATVESAPELALEAPEPVSIEEARRGAAHYRGLPDGEFCRCFVCGRAREDSLEVFAGAVEGRELVVASPWTPPAWAADSAGNARPEVVAGVLDCPTYFAAYMHEELRVSFLARFQLRFDAPLAVGEEHVVIAWPIEIDGRKLHAGSAVLAADGTVRSMAQALLIEPRA